MTTQTPQSYGASAVDGEQTPTAGEAVGAARERAVQVGGTAREEAAGVAQEAGHQARDLVGEARGQVRQQLDSQRGRLSDLLSELSEELEQMAGASERKGLASELARQASSRARDVRGYLDGGGDPLGDVRRFARRRPGTFLVGTLAAGVFAGRATRAATAARGRRQEGGSWTSPDAGTSPSTTSGASASGGYGSGGYGSGGYGPGGYGPGYGSAEYAGAATTGQQYGQQYGSTEQYPAAGRYSTPPASGHQAPTTGYAAPTTDYPASGEGAHAAEQSYPTAASPDAPRAGAERFSDDPALDPATRRRYEQARDGEEYR